tara:strand:+ start:331 stop:1482 length:1152 start_codon:yes stop_codon:yes gene_type:complete
MFKQVKLEDIAENIDYGLTASAEKKRGKAKFLRITDIQDDAVDWGTVPFCNADARSLATRKLNAGDIVFARTGATTGKSFLIRNCPRDAVFASYLIRVTPGRKVVPEYLSHYFRTDLYWSQIRSKSTGAGQPGVNASKLATLLVPLPPLEEQKRIASILDQADALRRLRQRAIDRASDLCKGQFSLLSRSANSTRRTRLSEVMEIGSSTVDPKVEPYANQPHVSPEHIAAHSGRVSWQDVRTAKQDGIISGKYTFRSNDILLSKIRPYLNKVAIADRDGICSADMYVLCADASAITLRFLKYLLMSPAFLGYAETNSTRANIPKINRAQLSKFEFNLPELAVQTNFETFCLGVERQVATQTYAAAKTEEVFASLQQRAFRGDL